LQLSTTTVKMRVALLATTLGAAQSLAVANKSKKPAIQALMESAATMLKNGATSAVVDFAEQTLGEVAGVVIPAIINESENDQRFIYSLHSRFQVIHDELEASNREVFQLNAEEQTLSAQHKECRVVERQRCDGKRDCEMELYRLWTIWVEEEGSLKVIHDHISGHFCPPDANGTLHAFRVASVPWMTQYMDQKIVVEAAELAYDAKVPICDTANLALDDKSSVCNAHQTHLEEKACAHAMKISDVLNVYYNDQVQAQSAYNCAVEEIMQLERDRKREWVTLQVVNCLLERIREQNGVPCDESNGGVTEEVGVCEQRHGITVCSDSEGEPRLCLDYPLIPPHPPLCAARDQVTGVCLPDDIPVPCGGDFVNQEYGALPIPYQGEFTATNPGCNAYPECVGCSAIPPLQVATIDSCPGYTVDGCVGSDAEAGEHPLTFVRDVDGKADVRCCSIDGDACQSKNFEGGVTFETPDGGAHEGCYFDVTYQEAMDVCHDAGMRMCSNDEMQTCCNTGCWHNHHAIWVDVANQQLD
jgi:hypothetical protein